MTCLDESARQDLVETLKRGLISDSAASLLDEIQAKVTKSLDRSSREREIETRFGETRQRLLSEVKALQRRGNLNLVFGGVVTLGALYVLWTTISGEVTIPHDPWALARHFGPRLALALFLEVFAYFFLKLYKSSLSEIKYFQNELTNVEARQLAIAAAMSTGDNTVTAGAISKLMETERNHVLTKDQTTVELEKARLDRDQRSEIFKSAAELFKRR